MRVFCGKELPKATIALVAANVLFFLYLTVTGSSLNSWYMIEKGALYVPAVLRGKEYYRLITSMFMHFGFEHLLFNMLLLLYLGNILEKKFGSVIFSFIYLVSGLMGNLASLVYYSLCAENVVSAGASGAIYGLVGLIAYLVYYHRGYCEGISARQIILMVVFSLYGGFADGGTNNTAHIAGLIAGGLCGLVFYRSERSSKEY